MQISMENSADGRGGNKMVEGASGSSRDEVTRAGNYLIRA